MKKEITILEDDRDIREICTYLFTSEGYIVNGYGSVSSFNSSSAHPDLYLLDVRLPDGNGLEVCHRLKGDPDFSDVPIIMMSAHLDADTLGSHCRAEAFIAKPFHIADLLARADELIDGYRLGKRDR